MTLAMVYWRLTGTGISSRLAEDMLEHLDRLYEAPSFKQLPTELRTGEAGTFAVDTICQRIADLLERAPVGPPRSQKVSKSDVFLYPTGMSAIYHCNQLLQKAQRATQSIVFGFPYELTLKLLQTYSKSCKFYGFGTAEELDELEAYLESEADQGRAVQTVWCECASNPLLRTVDLNRIRRLADKFGFAVVVDETIGSFANVDMLGVADIIVTSLTKSFSGYADVMGGRYVPHPNPARTIPSLCHPINLPVPQHRPKPLFAPLPPAQIRPGATLPQHPPPPRRPHPRAQQPRFPPPRRNHERYRHLPGLPPRPPRPQPRLYPPPHLPPLNLLVPR